MALSEREQKIFNEMEQALLSDTSFTSKMEKTASSLNRYTALSGVVVVAGLVLLLVGVVLKLTIVGVFAFLVMLTGGALFATKGKQAKVIVSTSVPNSFSQNETSGERPGFMSKLERRWQKRKEGH